MAMVNHDVNWHPELLINKKLFLFDIDGTIALSDNVIDGTRELLAYIKKIGGRAIYITNNSSKSTADYVARFERMQLEADPTDFVTAGNYTRDFFKKNYPKARTFVIATDSYFTELKNAGLNVTNEYDPACEVILACFDTELNYKKVEDACRLLCDKSVERKFYATNADLRCPVDFGMIPDCGSICNMITAATDVEPEYLGKPAPGLVNYSMEMTGFTKEQTIVVGDRIYTDIACGENAGVHTCLVFTGEAKDKDILTAKNHIDLAFPSVKELYVTILRELQKAT